MVKGKAQGVEHKRKDKENKDWNYTGIDGYKRKRKKTKKNFNIRKIIK